MKLNLISKIMEIIRYLNLRYCKHNIFVNKYLRISKMCEFRVFGKLCFRGTSCLSSGFSCGVAEHGEVYIGSNTYFGRNCIIASQKKVEVGDNTIFGPNVMIYDHDHAIINGYVSHNEFTTADVIIGSNCWIGAGVIILKGSIIGDGSIVGAGTVIKGVTQPKSIVYNNQTINSKSIKY